MQDDYNARNEKEEAQAQKEKELEELKKDHVRLQNELSKWKSNAVTSALKGTEVGKAVLKDLEA